MSEYKPELRITYLTVQRLGNPITYKVLASNTTDSLPGNSRVQALLDHAARCSSDLGLDTRSRLRFMAYELVNPITSFVQPLKEIKDQLGDLDESFFDEKAIHRLPNIELSRLKPGDGRIVVVIEATRKRLRSPSPETMFDRIKNAKITRIAPCTMARLSEYRSIQAEPDQRILDDRPHTDEGIPPLPLLYDGFGHFLDIFHGSSETPDLPGLDILGLRRAVDRFASAMCMTYTNKKERRNEGLPSLNYIFSHYTATSIPLLTVTDIGTAATDGWNFGAHGAGVMFVEFEHEIGCGSTITEVKLASCVAHSHANLKGQKERDLLDRWRMPALGLVVMGANIQFFGFVVLDGQYRSVVLTPLLSCTFPACDRSDRPALYKAFAGAAVLQARILQDGEEFIANLLPVIPADSWRLPAVSKLPKWPRSSVEESTGDLTFHIRTPFGGHHSQLYLANTPGPEGRTILVKFAPSYSIELHSFCASQGCAPPILAFGIFPGGWRGIAMEYLESANSIALDDCLALGKEFAAKLEDVVRGFHDQGLVHGDLRDTNILCDKDGKPFLVDFDWGGKAGEVSYATPGLGNELLVGRTWDDWGVRKEDDIRVLGNTLMKYGLSLST